MSETAIRIINYVMIALGSLLMVYNIILYYGFTKKISSIKSAENKKFLIYFPWILLMFFLVGYIAVGAFGNPSTIMSGILFGGSIYVFVFLRVVYRIVDRIIDNDLILSLRYEDIRNSVERLTKSANFVLYVNLSKDLIIEKTAKKPYKKYIESTSYVEFLDSLREQMVQRINNSDNNLFTLEGLLNSFNSGRSQLSEVVLISRDNTPTFVKLEAELAKQTQTGNIMAFITENDYNDEMVNESIIDNVLEQQYDFIAYVREEEFHLMVKNPNATLVPDNINGNLNEYLDEYVVPIISDNDNADALRPVKVLQELNEGKPYEVIVVLNDGKVTYKQYSYYLLDKESHFYILFVDDITEAHVEQANLNDRLQKALEDSQRATQSKTIFFSNISHDIRTPMNAIIAFNELSKNTDDLDKIKEYMNKIDSASHHLLNLLNDVLEMSRIESGKMELIPVDTDIKDILRDVYNILHVQIEGKGLEFIIEEDVTHEFVSCDKNRLNRAIINLVNNACKFTESGYIKVSLKETAFDGNNVTFEFRVKDTGIGMTEEFSKKIYDAFARERTSDVNSVQGSGLGMAITKSIVTMMNGTIDLITDYGKGTEFVITVTFELLHHKYKESEAKTDKKVDYTKLVGIKVLNIDDTEMNREIMESVLNEIGVNLIQAENGKEAFDMLDDNIDVVLSDVQMPVMDGFEFAAKVRNEWHNKNIPMIAITANAFKEDIDKALAAGFDAVVTKPVNMDYLVANIIELLNL